MENKKRNKLISLYLPYELRLEVDEYIKKNDMSYSEFCRKVLHLRG